MCKRLKPRQLLCLHSPLSSQNRGAEASSSDSEDSTGDDYQFGQVLEGAAEADDDSHRHTKTALQGADTCYTNIFLQFETVIKSCNDLNFVCFLYQEYNNPTENKFLVYDIINQSMVQKLTHNNFLQINPKEQCVPYLETDALGLNSFRLCRTTEVVQNEPEVGMVE
jgi:hypothetical protein